MDNFTLLGLLNSKVVEFYYQIVCPIRQNGYRFYAGTFLKKLPIPTSLSSDRKIRKIVGQILSTTKNEDYSDDPDKKIKVHKLEKEIDRLVYKLYDLTEEEIKIVEDFNQVLSRNKH